ncbi:MAG TPA: DUF4350 domain-containing protein [Kofleriaceae bacterium]
MTEPAAETGPFSRTALRIVIGVVAISLIAAVVLTFVGSDLDEKESAGVDGYSVSAIGHRGLSRLLQNLDIPVVISRSDSPAKAKNGLLIVAEPTVGSEASAQRLHDLVDAAPVTLVVLPKWYSTTELGQRWIDDANFLPESEVTPVLKALNIDATITRPEGPVTWSVDKLRPELHEPQLLRSTALEATVETTDGNILLAHWTTAAGHEVWILSDPDVLNNYGLRIRANAQFTVDLIERLHGTGPVILDETLHGYAQQPTLSHTLFRFPLVFATLQVLLCSVLVVWAAMVRFGPRREAPPPIAPGKDFLVRNTAALLAYGGHHAYALHRYFHQSVAAVRHTLHAPQLQPAAQRDWLERVRLTRKGKLSLVEVENQVDAATTPQRVIAAADLIYRWRMEMTDGTKHRS